VRAARHLPAGVDGKHRLDHRLPDPGLRRRKTHRRGLAAHRQPRPDGAGARLGVPAVVWLELEAEHHRHLLGERYAGELEEKLDWLDQLPVRALIKAKWAEKQPTRLAQADWLLRWFGVSSPERWRRLYLEPQATYTSSPPLDSNPASLAAWMRAGEKQAYDMKTPPFNRKTFRQALAKIRRLTTRMPDKYQDGMIAHCIASGVALAWAREMPGLKVAGASRWLSPQKALIQLSLYHRTDAELWYTFFHQAAHILLHGRKRVFIDGRFEDHPRRDDVFEEVEADHFAANFLVPTQPLERLRAPAEQGELSRKAIKTFARELGVTAGIVVTRLQRLGWIPPKKFNTMKTLLAWAPPGTYANV
jgi:hypothetical protein